MNSVNSLCNSVQPPLLHFKFHQWRYQNPMHFYFPNRIFCSFGRRRPRRRNRNTSTYTISKPSPAPNENLEMVIDVENFKIQTSSTLSVITQRLNEFIFAGKDTYRDLQTLITFDNNRGIVVSCRQSSMLFLGKLLIGSCVILLVFRVLFQIGKKIRNKIGLGDANVVVRRDRSLGGKQVVVGKNRINATVRSSDNLLSPSLENAVKDYNIESKNRVPRGNRLPKWWPVLLPGPTSMEDKEEYQRNANRIIRAIMDNRMVGQDIFIGDIIHLRRICRTTGVRVSIDTINVRDSIYRGSVDFVLNTCSSASNDTSVEIDGEDVRQFVAGLADNIGLDYIRAARMVSAGVAARTRAYILQAWALEMQGRHSEAMAEVSKMCCIHRIFPPEESSAEMEMVARGLEKHLKLDQRELLMKMLLAVCGEDSRRSAAEALGLVNSPPTLPKSSFNN